MTTNTTPASEPSRVSVDEVLDRLNRGEKITFIDTRNPQAWASAQDKMPEAIRIAGDQIEQQLPRIPHNQTIVTYCTWPNEGSSASLARELMKHGFDDVHPLLGGYDEWKKAGGPVEPK